MLVLKNLPAMQETQVWSLGQEDLLEKGMATHSSILAWETPWTEEPGRLQFLGLQRVGHNLATKQQQPQDNQSQGMQHFVGIESCKSLGSLKSLLWSAP